MAREFVFIDEWHVQAPIESVFEAVSDIRTYPDWWNPVYREVEAPGPPALGSVSSVAIKGRLPYQLKFKFEIVRLNPPCEYEVRAQGDLSGRGIWTLTPSANAVHIRFDWRVTADRFLLRILSPLMWPLLRWNHNWCIVRAKEGLQRYLQNRTAQ